MIATSCSELPRIHQSTNKQSITSSWRERIADTCVSVYTNTKYTRGGPCSQRPPTAPKLRFHASMSTRQEFLTTRSCNREQLTTTRYQRGAAELSCMHGFTVGAQRSDLNRVNRQGARRLQVRGTSPKKKKPNEAVPSRTPVFTGRKKETGSNRKLDSTSFTVRQQERNYPVHCTSCVPP